MSLPILLALSSKATNEADALAFVEDTVMVLLPTARVPEASKLTGVPAIVTPGQQGLIVVPSTEIALGLAVNVWLPMV